MSRIKKYIDSDVYTEAKKRINHIIDIFDSVVVMFSGGKDSLAVLHLVKECFDERGIKKPVNVIFRDEELIPDSVISFVNEYRQKDWIDMKWFCVPLRSTKYILGVCYDYVQWGRNRELTRDVPEFAITLDANDDREFDQYSMDLFCSKFYKGKVAFITGIRASESLMRFKASLNKYNENYINAVDTTDKVKLCKPLYDWEEDDIFRYFYENGIKYCPIYDHQMWNKMSMRVSTPIHAEQAKRFDKLRASAPELYQRVVKVFPEMLAQERYYSEYDRSKIIEKYSSSFEGVRAWIEDNITDEKQYQLALKRLKQCQVAYRTKPFNYPPEYVLKQFISGAFKRNILPLVKKR